LPGTGAYGQVLAILVNKIKGALDRPRRGLADAGPGIPPLVLCRPRRYSVAGGCFTVAGAGTPPSKEEDAMTNPQGLPLGAPLAAEAVSDRMAEENDQERGPTVGRSDADADAARSGADTDLSDATRDSDGVPVGSDDADEDARRSGAD